MSTPSYAVAGLVLSPNPAFSPQVRDLQQDLRSLGYGKGPIDGVFGPGTGNAVRALEFDLMNNDGSSSQGDGSAPVAVKNYNNGSVTSLTGVVDQELVACIVAMLGDAAFPKVPSSPNPAADNQSAIAAVTSMASPPVPIPFLMAILMQESALMHFQVPSGANSDNCVTIGLDRNNASNPAAITSLNAGGPSGRPDCGGWDGGSARLPIPARRQPLHGGLRQLRGQRNSVQHYCRGNSGLCGKPTYLRADAISPGKLPECAGAREHSLRLALCREEIQRRRREFV